MSSSFDAIPSSYEEESPDQIPSSYSEEVDPFSPNGEHEKIEPLDQGFDGSCSAYVTIDLPSPSPYLPDEAIATLTESNPESQPSLSSQYHIDALSDSYSSADIVYNDPSTPKQDVNDARAAHSSEPYRRDWTQELSNLLQIEAQDFRAAIDKNQRLAALFRDFQ